MAWSWSHTARAYAYAHDECMKLPRETLLVILAEWRMHDKHPGNDAAWADQWPKSLRIVTRRCRDLSDLTVAKLVWERAEEQQTCDNGGYNAWLCPYGCWTHCVDFGPEGSKECPSLMLEAA